MSSRLHLEPVFQGTAMCHREDSALWQIIHDGFKNHPPWIRGISSGTDRMRCVCVSPRLEPVGLSGQAPRGQGDARCCFHLQERRVGALGGCPLRSGVPDTVTEALTVGGGHTTQRVDGVLWDCLRETCIVSLSSVI